ncbi:MAG: LysM peptidoglycan-binding domain-containing protein [Gammaproteobacteria bacterium]|nr:LysM peptidoglycan-binding domain-containing protein [Gammaproteobacteria bacterium]
MRNLGLIISFWLSAISIPTNSIALGLGGIEVNSFLNQPLKAEIEVLSARPGEIDDLLVSLASRDAFARAGLSRPLSLNDIKFTVEKSEEGDTAVILVTTKAAIKEPFLNFLVEADWSKGRLLREFTVLLDPPFYADSSAPTSTQTVEPEPVLSEQAPIIESDPEVSTPIVESESATFTSTTEQQTITEPIALSDEDQVDENDSNQSPSTGMVSQGDVVIEKGDTLWSIASALRDSGYSMSQIMLAIQRANPDAFGDDNINNLKVGSVLRMPDADEIGALDQQQAYAQVLEQNGLWDDYVARVTDQSTIATVDQSSAESSSEDSSEASGELKLVTPGDGSSDAAGLQSEGDDANELRLQLTLAEEELDASRVQNSELESRIAELEAQLSKFEELQKMVEIEDDSLAKLQEDQAQEAEETIVSEALSEVQKSADEDALLEELLTEDEDADTQAEETTEIEEATEAEETIETEAASGSTIEDSIVAEALDESGESADKEEADTFDTDEQAESSAPPIIVTEETQQEPSFLDGILPAGILDMLPDLSGAMPSADGLAFDPVLLGGLGGILLLIIGLIIYRRRKSNDEDVVENDPIFALDGDDEEDELTPIHLAENVFDDLEDDEAELSIPEEDLLPASMTEEEEEDVFSKTAVISGEDMPTPEEPAEPATEEQDDILNEADVYLAYNLYDNAEELLTSSLETTPERADYRAKLLDTYFATKNVSAFVSQAETLKSMGRPAERYWDRVMVMGFELAPENQLFAAAKDSGISAADLEFSKPAAADFDLGAEEDDTNFSTTDFDLGEEDTGTLETNVFSPEEVGSELKTQQFDSLSSETDAEVEIDEDSLSLPGSIGLGDATEEIASLDFSFDDDEADISTQATEAESGNEDLDFGLPDDLDLGGDELDLGAESTAVLDIESTAVLEVGTAVIDTNNFDADLDLDDQSDDMESTAVISSEDLVTDDEIDFGMEDTAMIDSSDFGDDEDILLDLGDMDDVDSLSMDVDLDADNSKTDTFSPGDFDDPEEIEVLETDIGSAGLDDIEDLMLPDDVDEVSTKLDLARAFIDMGDAEGARSSLEEVMQEGNDEQKAEAQSLIGQL